MREGKPGIARWAFWAGLILAAAGIAAFLWYRGQGPALDLSLSVQGLPPASQPQTVDLANGAKFTLVASPVTKKIGTTIVRELGYNGSSPGPFLRVHQGDQVEITLVNHCGLPTTIHHHGVRVENSFDGVPDVTQKAVPPGKSFVYRVRFPDPGIYWYHPHFREDYAQELGLFGVYLVAPSEANYWPPANREVVLTLHDLLLKDGKIPEYLPDRVNFAFMGRFGNTILVNGQTDYKLELKKGEVVRFYLLNASSARPYRLFIPGAKMKLVGGDNGRVDHEVFLDALVIAPSERWIVDVFFPQPGTYKLTHHAEDPLVGPRTYELATFQVSGDAASPSYEKEFLVLRENQPEKALFDQLVAKYRDARPEKTLRLTVDATPAAIQGVATAESPEAAQARQQLFLGMLTALVKKGAKVEWEDHMYQANKSSTSKDVHWKLVDLSTGASGEAIQGWDFSRDGYLFLRLINDIHSLHPMQHPIHIHGQRFLVLATNAEENKLRVWKDTVQVGAGDTVDLLVELSNPGKWMAHCHILEHLHSGMFLVFRVN
ncbi:multicopper oxidase family protein [Candidatus Methylacidithermus pantelleriae]|uniref:Multicopper oxidase n=1 Tax=Candidatus Methylacidithermus pantelleriae TaxID=2744239 RepID=A0A8J2FPK4_9BACT|nr:multicopper oxidase family protein [Candidatus Methylacidithermus pantelleriae]CAF0703489.1 Multicopper oxidase [Candidatus Methylacidithermus pantelleriae]